MKRQATSGATADAGTMLKKSKKSEIDDIFAAAPADARRKTSKSEARSESKEVQASDAPNTAGLSKKARKKAAAKARAAAAVGNPGDEDGDGIEVVVAPTDPGITVLAQPGTSTGVAHPGAAGGEADAAYSDLKGSANRKRTEEGYAVYYEDELGLVEDPNAGETDLCPFDCKCCF
ncbi:hypothetical protein PYCC9005_003358 [Savitreella phatthalungensis]